MTRIVNLARFASVTLSIALAFAFNLAAMYAQVVYVFLPGTRAHGQPAAQWGFDPHQSSGLLTTIGSSPVLMLGGCLAVMAVCAIVVRRSPK